MASDECAGPAIAVEVAYSPAARRVDNVTLRLPVSTSAIDAVRRSGLVQRYGLDEQTLRLGIWGRSCGPEQMLRDRDRVEVYRPLSVDPKEARRLRYRATGRRIVSRHRPLSSKTGR